MVSTPPTFLSPVNAEVRHGQSVMAYTESGRTRQRLMLGRILFLASVDHPKSHAFYNIVLILLISFLPRDIDILSNIPDKFIPRNQRTV